LLEAFLKKISAKTKNSTLDNFSSNFDNPSISRKT